MDKSTNPVSRNETRDGKNDVADAEVVESLVSLEGRGAGGRPAVSDGGEDDGRVET